MIEDEVFVISRCRGSEGSLLSDTDGVDLCRMTTDLSNRVSGVCGETVPISLLPVTDGNDALAVSIPSEVVNPAGDDGVFSLSKAGSIR